MEATSAALSAVSLANIGILCVLIAVYARMRMATRARLPLGMTVVCSLLLLHNAIGALAYFSMEELFSHAVFPYMLGVGIAELAGLAILLRLALE
ncbi:MAG: hypothetical protein OXU86_04180 [Thaumarchaeota archaeon]|nr:hypothetical protein [Nitrososphaerota archaeon]RNJ71904.1 MAG: hypothetical protein EB824_06450 [Thaumarchaeota archaeon S15]RNJ73557.1 MAG: hypothetical protein EB832_01565 [Thaumarchaeota archaeon S14]RNJ74429.1 MAG: hypothetical protein EB833_00660 [Thaumarchaeota archaeon S13]MDD9808746.1 hypothetical protein [Nitrososphaerota archaeon]